MDDFEDLFSFEALQLLANNSTLPATANQTTKPIPHGNDGAVTSAPQQQNQILGNHANQNPQARGSILVNDTSAPDPYTQTRRKRKRRNYSDAIPGCSTIESTGAQVPKLKRSKFRPERKKEVARIRLIGACLRCRHLKISCSEIWPCPPCRRSKSACYGRAPNFRYDTIPPSASALLLKMLDSGYTSDQLAKEYINGKTIDFGDVQLAFESEVLWDLDAMVSEFADWMSHGHVLPASTSRVGILSSPKFRQLVRTIADEELTRVFRLLVESSSVLYNYDGELDISWKDYLKDDLESIRSFAGTSVLRHLERVLSNIALAGKSLKEMKALFLILLGTIIAVEYSQPVGHNQKRPGSSARSYGEAQQQLLRILAHHMVQIAERASILDQDADKTFLIERANHLWDRQATFGWEMVDVFPCDSSTGSDDDSIDREEDGSGFNIQTRQDDVASDYNEFEPPSPLQQSPCAQELFTYQPDPTLDPSWTKCHSCNMSLDTEAGTLCDSCSRYLLPCEAGRLQHAQASLTTPASSLYSASKEYKKIDSSQGMAEVSLHSLADDTSYQNKQQSSCLSCGNTDLWPGASFCLSCSLGSDPPESPFDTPPCALLHVPQKFSKFSPNQGTCCGHQPQDRASVREPCHCSWARSNHPCARGHKTATGNSGQKRRNLLCGKKRIDGSNWLEDAGKMITLPLVEYEDIKVEP